MHGKFPSAVAGLYNNSKGKHFCYHQQITAKIGQWAQTCRTTGFCPLFFDVLDIYVELINAGVTNP
jgi:hypothetical protein